MPAPGHRLALGRGARAWSVETGVSWQRGRESRERVDRFEDSTTAPRRSTVSTRAKCGKEFRTSGVHSDISLFWCCR